MRTDFIGRVLGIAHELSGQAAIQPRFHADDRGPPAFGSVGGNADDRYAIFFRIIDERGQILGVSRREDDSVHAALNQLFESLGIFMPERLYRAIDKLNSQLSKASSFFEDSAPELIVEKMDFTRHAHADARDGFGDR